jgi:hypothetical protein
MSTQPEHEWTPPTPRAAARLHEHISGALYAVAKRVIAQHPHPELREHIATWMETAHELVEIEAHVARGNSGRIDTRSLRLDCYLQTSQGRAPLCSVRVRDLVDGDGERIDARSDARTLLLQNGHGIPDSPATLHGDAA